MTEEQLQSWRPIWMQMQDAGYNHAANTHEHSFAPPKHWEASLSGFHNPRKHQGITSQRFLELYLQRTKSIPQRIKHYTYVASHQDEALQFIRKRFKRTLQVG